MFYKLSNTAQRQEIEHEFDAIFEYPKLYKPSPVINGLEESVLPIITIEDPQKINYAIWGLLPESLEENWEVFQEFTNTLNINIDHLDSNDILFSDALDHRRCLIVSTGFFTTALQDGKMYTHHVYLNEHKPFCIAGVYNRLDDGFFTCSILIKKTNNELGEIPNMVSYKPVIFDSKDQIHWLNPEYSFDILKGLIKSHHHLQYFSNPVSKEFYNNNVAYDDFIKTYSKKHTIKSF